jgi:hypothetical protein
MRLKNTERKKTMFKTFSLFLLDCVVHIICASIGFLLYEKRKDNKKYNEAFKKLQSVVENYNYSQNPKTLKDIIYENNL